MHCDMAPAAVQTSGPTCHQKLHMTGALFTHFAIIIITKATATPSPCSLTSPSLSSPRQRQHQRLVHSLRHHYHHQGNGNTIALFTHFAIIIITKATATPRQHQCLVLLISPSLSSPRQHHQPFTCSDPKGIQ